ncbi:DEAD/DEAH box helicase [Variovorax boronicumulans]|uniref:DEAD/DEAH box helicase n=1 Tax=Variovorax boronicumulans TaxID=436515 RepID=UPI0027D822C6|nr:3'-5' exonuclease [Variovorax boronicumulans]
MAIFPQGKTAIERRCNPGERKLFHALRRHLTDDYLVWHDLPIGDAGLQPDFVILSPRQGLLVLEVKDWKYGTLVGADKHHVQLKVERGVVSSAHPHAQARQHALALVDRMQEDPLLVQASGLYKGKLIFPWGWGCALVNIAQDQIQDPAFGDLFPDQRTLLRDDLADDVDGEAFGQRLWQMMQVSFPHTLTLPQRDRVRWHLFPSLRVEPVQATLDAADAGPAMPLKIPDLMQVMDMQQEREARRMGDGHRVIHGVAGSGKTMILVFRAQYLSSAAAAVGRPVLVLCYNRALAERIAYLLAVRGVVEEGRGVVVRSFHGWCEDMVRTYQLEVPLPRGSDAYFNALADTVRLALERGFVPRGQYTAVMIDEAHDFEDAWLRMATELVNPATRALLVLYDHTQAIYRKQTRKVPFKALGIDVVGGRRSSILRTNYRNTAEVLSLALRCTEGILTGVPLEASSEAVPMNDSALGDLIASDEAADEPMPQVHPDTAGRRGPMPVLYEAHSGREEAQWQVRRITQLRSEGVSLGQIAVLFRYRTSMAALEAELVAQGIAHQSLRTLKARDLRWDMDALRILTVHSAKGLEFSHVFVGAINEFDNPREPREDELRLLYIAMTRATLWLGMSSQRGGPMVTGVRAQLRRLEAEWAKLQ